MNFWLLKLCFVLLLQAIVIKLIIAAIKLRKLIIYKLHNQIEANFKIFVNFINNIAINESSIKFLITMM